MKIYAVGDIHGYWQYLNRFINKKNPDIILQCGDFGWFPSCHNTKAIGKAHLNSQKLEYEIVHPWNQYGIKNRETKIYWCDGNHEDHWNIKNLENRETQKNVFYQPRGSWITLPDGRIVLFIGGADSIDKKFRTIGIDWFPEEIITQKDVFSIPDDLQVDIIISHTCPEEFLPYLKFNSGKCNDPSCKALSYILDKYKPSQWFFGHWHQYKTGYNNGCHWTALNMANDSGWWEKIK